MITPSSHVLCALVSLCLITWSSSQSAFGQTVSFGLKSRSETVELENRLSLRLGLEKAAILVENYGSAAEEVLKLDEELSKIRNKNFKAIDREGIALAYDRIASFDPKGVAGEDRRRLSRVWQRMAQFTLRLDGTTIEAYEQLKIALELDPSNENLAREVEYQRVRQELAEQRLKDAEKFRNGENPNPTEYVGSN